MSKLIFTFDRDWLNEKRKEYGNPIRKMERFVREEERVKLIKSDYDSVTIELEENERESFIKAVYEYVQGNFGEETPASCVRIGGDIRNLDLPEEATRSGASSRDSARQESSEREEKKEETTEQPAEASEEKKAEEPAPESRDVKPVSEEKEPEQHSGGKSQEKSEQPAEAPVEEKAEPHEIQPADENAVLASTIEKICESIPMKYSPALADYIKEMGQVIPMLRRMHSEDCIWSQNLLVAIDNGFGFSSFLSAMHQVYQCCGLVEKANSERELDIKEIIIARKSGENMYDDWKEAASRARDYSSANKRKSQKVILAFDIRQWQGNLAGREVINYMRQINEAASNFICVFRVPFMEAQVLQQISECISDVMAVKTLMVPPISLEQLTDYFKNELKRLNCNVVGNCDEAIAQWITREKSDGSFFGYKTVDKMVKQLIYTKALSNCKGDGVNREIVREDMVSFLREADVAEDPYELLQGLIGMQTVKERIKSIMIQIKTQQELAAQGKSVDRPAIHMMFVGNPGTGKTTVARILARIMKQEGVLSKGLFFEIKARDLCGRYVGETAPKTSAYCRDAYGSILFIDEAYALYQRDNGRDYGKEAIDTMIAEMENHRDNFCVIMAGYKKEMLDLFDANPGLESRIPYVIEFPNYSREELEEIFFKMNTFEYEEGLVEAVRAFFQAIPDKVLEDKSFSNARLVRNLYERAWGKAAYRRSLNNEQSLSIRKEDLISASNEDEFKKMMEEDAREKTIGFAY